MELLDANSVVVNEDQFKGILPLIIEFISWLKQL